MNDLDFLKGKRVVVGMSGGVDSSVTAHLLKEAGAEVTGVMMRLTTCTKTVGRQTCCSGADQIDAYKVCDHIGIPFKLIDVQEEFKEKVIAYFVDGYARGETPNPCVKCNETIKFAGFKAKLDELFDYEYIATGHYARIAKQNDHGKPEFRLMQGVDPKKDQSYFLWTLKPGQLAQTIFPLGELTKEKVRQIADEAGLPTAAKKESQDICFVGDGDYAGFISDYFPDQAGAPGNFVDADGEVLGTHDGIHAYTIGKRRGLGIGFSERKYVVAIDAARNEIRLGHNADLMKSDCVAENVNWIREPTPSHSNVVAKIRYSHPGVAARLTPLADTTVKVEFATPERAVTPGQAIVFYDGAEVLGGGWVKG